MEYDASHIPENSVLTEDEYYQELVRLFELLGPNDGVGFHGQWAWKLRIAAKVNDALAKRGISVKYALTATGD